MPFFTLHSCPLPMVHLLPSCTAFSPYYFPCNYPHLSSFFIGMARDDYVVGDALHLAFRSSLPTCSLSGHATCTPLPASGALSATCDAMQVAKNACDAHERWQTPTYNALLPHLGDTLPRARRAWLLHHACANYPLHTHARHFLLLAGMDAHAAQTSGDDGNWTGRRVEG